MWSSLGESKFLQSKGKKVRMGRWYSLFTVADEREGDDGKLLLVLLYLGLKGGWRPSIWQSPVCHYLPAEVEAPKVAAHAAAELQPGDAGAASSSTTRPQTIKASNAQVEALRQGSKNTMELGCKILANTLN
jgi:hypothetical protein